MMDPAARAKLRNYADAIAMWSRGFDTAWIARELGLAEHMVERWIWNFREVMRAPAAA